jgi:hypothetical protein
MVPSPITRFRSTTRSKIWEEGDNMQAPEEFNLPKRCAILREAKKLRSMNRVTRYGQFHFESTT